MVDQLPNEWTGRLWERNTSQLPKSFPGPCGMLGLHSLVFLHPPISATTYTTLWYSILSSVLILHISDPHLRTPPLHVHGRIHPPPPPHSLEDSTLFQAVLAAISHGCVVHSLNGTVNSLEDILFHALKVGG